MCDVTRVVRRGWLSLLSPLLLAALVCCLAVVSQLGGMVGGIAFASDGQIWLHRSYGQGEGGTGEPRFSLAPAYYDPSDPASLSYFILNTRQGTLVHNALRVTNVGTQKGTVSLFAADASTAQMTGIVYSSANPAQHEVGSWLSLSMKQVTLTAGQSLLIPFTVRVPNGEEPGQHMGGIIAQSAAEPTSSGVNSSGNVQFQVSLVHQQIIALQVDVQGRSTQQLAASSIQAGTTNGNQELLIDLHNPGNTMLKPQGSLQIMNTQGQILQTLPLSMDIILPGTGVSYQVVLSGQPFATGTYRASLTLTYGESHMLTYATNVLLVRQEPKPDTTPAPSGSGFPTWLIVVLAALALVAIVLAGGLRAKVAGPAGRATTKKRTRRRRR